jgi:hypothetical protein
MLPAPIVTAIVVAVTSTILGIAFAFGWLFHHDWGTPAYKRELEATYASFRRFLTTVQAVVVKRCRSNSQGPQPLPHPFCLVETSHLKSDSDDGAASNGRRSSSPDCDRLSGQIPVSIN